MDYGCRLRFPRFSGPLFGQCRAGPHSRRPIIELPSSRAIFCNNLAQRSPSPPPSVALRIQASCEIFRFCRSKCHKNFKMKRNPRKVKWTKAHRKIHGKDMTQDATFEFERKRNRPEKYDRNVAENTLKAIKKIDKVRVDREARHHTQRMKGKKATDVKAAVKELEQSIHMVKAPSVLKEDPSLSRPKFKVKIIHSFDDQVEQ